MAGHTVCLVRARALRHCLQEKSNYVDFCARLCDSDGGMPRDLDLRKLQAFGSEIVDLLAQPPDRVYVALAEGKIMVLDRLLVKHVLRCAHPILQSVSGATLPKQRMFLLPHESSLRYGTAHMSWDCLFSEWGLTLAFSRIVSAFGTAAVYSAPHIFILRRTLQEGVVAAVHPQLPLIPPAVSWQ